MNKVTKYFIVSICYLIISGCSTTSNSANINLNKASNLNSSLGLAYMQKGVYEIAHSKLTKAIYQNSENYNAHLYMAELQKILKVNDKADNHYKIALELAPSNSRIKNNYGVFLCNEGKFAESVVLFADVITDPFYKDKVGAYENLGICEQKKGDLHLAEKHFRYALKLNHNLPKSLLAMTQISYDAKLYKPARRYYSRFLSLSKQTPASLWMGVLLELKYKNDDIVDSYATLLRVKYPDSDEAILLDKLQGRDSIK